jgi:Tol biopolymer transport system component
MTHEGTMRDIGRAVPGGRTGLSAVLLLLVLSACNENSASPVGPPASASALLAGKDGCFGRHDDCGQPRNGRMAWPSLTPTGIAIFSAEPDGSDLRQLTVANDPVFDDNEPDWSPDGSKIIFLRQYNCDTCRYQIFGINADGRNLNQLGGCTGDCVSDLDPSFSPDGRRVAFSRFFGPIGPDGNAADGGIWIMKADGSDPRQITQRRLPTTSEDHQPRWSPDGTKLVFMRLNTHVEPIGGEAIFVVNADGSDARRITPWALNAFVPDWSPDGRLILLSAPENATPSVPMELYTVHPDGSGLKKIMPQGIDTPPDFNPVVAALGRFSPDGRRIVFFHQETANSVLYKMNLDGSDLVRLTPPGANPDGPAWGTHP